jgi:hypothetical protein
VGWSGGSLLTPGGEGGKGQWAYICPLAILAGRHIWPVGIYMPTCTFHSHTLALTGAHRTTPLARTAASAGKMAPPNTAGVQRSHDPCGHPTPPKFHIYINPHPPSLRASKRVLPHCLTCILLTRFDTCCRHAQQPIPPLQSSALTPAPENERPYWVVRTPLLRKIVR